MTTLTNSKRIIKFLILVFFISLAVFLIAPLVSPEVYVLLGEAPHVGEELTHAAKANRYGSTILTIENIALVSSLLSSIGIISAILISWRKDKRESINFELELKKKEIEIKKLKSELKADKNN